MRRLSQLVVVAIALKLLAGSAAAGPYDDLTAAGTKLGLTTQGIDSGSTASSSDSSGAMELATSALDVRRVVSRIQPPDRFENEDQRTTKSGGIGGALSDLWLTSAAMVRLFADGDTPTIDINVETNNGVVTLFGTVPSQEASDAATQEVLKISRVTGVRNQLEIVPDDLLDEVRYQDDCLEQKVKASLELRDELSDVRVKVKNGVVRLTGTVPTSYDRQAAAMLAQATSGVRSVREDLTVSD